MSPKLQKVSLYVILALLFLFLPLTGYALYLKFSDVERDFEKENVNKEKKFDGKLWFYDEKGSLLGKYTCEYASCDFGASYEEDEKYAIDYYIAEETKDLPIVKNQYVFIHDSEKENHEVFLYDVKNNFSYKTNPYSSVKNYQIGLDKDVFIIESTNHLFGVLEFNPLPVMKIVATYNFLGIPKNQMDGDKILTDYFIGYRNNEWMIITDNEAKLTSGIRDEIVTFTGEFIIMKDAMKNYHISDYQNVRLLDGDFDNLYFVDRYLACLKDGEFYIYDLRNETVLSDIHKISQSDEVVAEMNENQEIVITINGRVAERIAI